jgi:Carboxypeptidase regulatory-like domain
VKLLPLSLCLALSVPAAADALHVSAGGQLRVSGTNTTAAYSIDTDCAEVAVENGVAVVTGKRPCVTHVVTIENGKITEREIFVSPRQEQLDRLRAARLLEHGIHETGYISTLYSSDPGQVETTLNMSRSEGNHTAGVSLSVANGYAFSPDKRQTAIPVASVRFAGPSSSLTLLDSFVDQSPLTLSGIDLRGLHVQSGSWFLHAGIASLTNFRLRMFEPDPDRTLDAGYRFNLTRHSGLIASTQWIHASPRYASGRSGLIGSLMYDYQDSERLRLQMELGLSSKIAGAALFNYIGSSDQVRFQVRSTPLSFPGLSAALARGFQGNGAWTRRLTNSLTLDVSGSRDTYTLLDGTTQANSSEDGRLQWRIKKFTFSGGFDRAELSRRNNAPIISNSVPVGFAFDSVHFGNSIQYQFRNNANDLGSYLIRDSVRIDAGPVRFTFYAARQTQAPTLDYVVTSVPGLRQALLAAGITATTPEEIADFLRAHSDLIAGGLISNLSLNLAPVRNEYGGTFKWIVRRNLLSIDFGYREVDDQRILGHVSSRIGDASASLRLASRTNLDITASLLETHAPGSTLRSPLLAIGIRQQLGSTPHFLNSFQQHGWIRGEVSTDENGDTAKGVGDVTIILDGVQRTRTNQSGFYSFHSVAEGKHLVEVQYPESGSYVFTSPPQVETEENTIVNFSLSARQAMLYGTVRNDGGMPIAKAVVRIQGPHEEQMRTGENGSFRFNLKDAGTYSVTLDAQSLPPAYDLASVTVQRAQVKVNDPARMDFVVRARRSIYGTVICTGGLLDSNKVYLRIDQVEGRIPVDQEGKYRINDLASGGHELTIEYGDTHLSRRVELPAEAANVSGIDLEVCSEESSVILRAAPGVH